MALTSEEVALLLQIARDATLGEGFYERIDAVTEALAVLVPCTSLSAFVVDPKSATGPSKAHLLFKNRDPVELASYATYYRHVDPMGGGFETLPDTPVQLSDFVGTKDFGGDEYTGDYLPRLGVRHILAVSHRMPGGSMLALALQRETGMRDFSARDREILRLSSPDIGRAAFGALLRERARPQPAAAGDAPLAESTTGVIVLTPLGDILHADAAALAILRATRSDSAKPEDLLVAEVRKLAMQPPGEGNTIERRFALEGGGFGRARLSWMSTGAGKSEIVAVLEALRPGSREHSDMIMAHAGLTPREREVAVHTVRGLGNRQIASELGISPITVGSHLTKVYEKTGTIGRNELTTLLLGGCALPATQPGPHTRADRTA